VKTDRPKPKLDVPRSLESRILDHLSFLYGDERAVETWHALRSIMRGFCLQKPAAAAARRAAPFTERDALLITYADQLQSPGTPHLQTLHQVLAHIARGLISGVHILPFFPYSSDDGFSVIDYTKVRAELGTWADVARLGSDFRLMFDVVINHVSRQSPWFQRFVAGDPACAEWFIEVQPEGSGTDWMSQVVRPRTLPLLTPVDTAAGRRLVWTTFSDDQIDLNYAHPAVLLAMIGILLLYVERGADIIRLDAIAYLWKKIGTPCIHLEETHRVVKLLRCVLEAVAPNVTLITETNVAQEDNISYFGAGDDEAHMVYQFPLAPLLMHTFLSGNSRALSEWAAGVKTPSSQTAFLNFTASHDGIGVMPARGLLTEQQIQALVDATSAHGGRVSYKTNPGGTLSAYELNISYFDALSNPHADELASLQVKRFAASQAIMLALAGVPGIYIHSLLGSRSWQEGVAQTGHLRSINRQKLMRTTLEQELADPRSIRHQVFTAYGQLLRARAASAAFHPQGSQRVLRVGDGVFALLRTSPDGESRVLCLHNVRATRQSARLHSADLGRPRASCQDLLTGEEYQAAATSLTIGLDPYAVRWLKLL